MARLNKAGAAGRRGRNLGTDEVDVLPTNASTMCTVWRGTGVELFNVQIEQQETMKTAFDGGNRQGLATLDLALT